MSKELLHKCADAVVNITRRMDAMMMRRHDAKTPVDRLVSELNAAMEADRYLGPLSDALGDEKKFPIIYESLKKLPLETVKELCYKFTSAKERTKSDALFRIWMRHQNLLNIAARARATGGRTAG